MNGHLARMPRRADGDTNPCSPVTSRYTRWAERHAEERPEELLDDPDEDFVYRLANNNQFRQALRAVFAKRARRYDIPYAMRHLIDAAEFEARRQANEEIDRER